MGERPIFFVAVDVIVVRAGKILLGMRKGSYGAGFWGLPGGHLEDKEGMAAAALRELKEETGIVASSAEFVALFNNKNRPDAEHYVHVTMLAEGALGEPQVTEPDRCSEWRWFPVDQIPFDKVLWVHVPQVRAYLEKSNFIDL